MRTLLTLRPPPSPPCLSSFSSSHPCFLLGFRPNHRFHFLTPCSSLKQTKKKSLQKTTTRPPSAPPQSLKWLFSSPKTDEGGEIEKTDRSGGGDDGDDGEAESGFALTGTVLAGLFLVALVGGFGAAGYVYKDQINAFLNQFSTLIEGKFSIFLYPFEVLAEFSFNFVDCSFELGFVNSQLRI